MSDRFARSSWPVALRKTTGPPTSEQREPQALPVIFLVGPTAVGKSRVAIPVAQALETEILTADSTQVYRGMDIGTRNAVAFLIV